MANKKNDNNDMIILDLDRKRVVKFTHKALKRLSALLGKPLHTVIIDAQEDIYDKLEVYMLCGLMKDAEENGELLKADDIDDILDKADNFYEITEACQMAFMKSLGYKEDEDQSENNQAATEKN